MTKLQIKPDVRLDGNQNVCGGLTGFVNHNDMKLSVRCTDETFSGGDMKGLTFRVNKPDSFVFNYDVGEHAPSMVLHKKLRVRQTDVTMRVSHSVKPKSATLVEAKFNVNDDNMVTLAYDLTAYDTPDLKRAALKWRYNVNEDVSVQPGYNFGTESLFGELRYRLDDENDLRARYDAHSKDAELEWRNSSGMGGGGGLKVVATTNLDDGLGKMPTLRASKEWDLDF